MSIHLKTFLGLITIFSPFIVGTYYIAKKEVEHNRLKGCICKHSYFGLISENCPLHRPFYILKHTGINRKPAYTRISASFGERIPVCNKCLQEIIPQNYICNWVETTSPCHICGTICRTRDIPQRDIDSWKNYDW